MYKTYVGNYGRMVSTLNIMRSNDEFQKFLSEQRTRYGGQSMMSYLIMPVQRIPRYVLLLRELKKYTRPEEEDFTPVCMALVKLRSIADEVNQSAKNIENMSKLLDLQNRLKSNPSYQVFMPYRYLVKEGNLNFYKSKTKVKEYRIYLFNDEVIRASLKWNLKEILILNNMQIRDKGCGTPNSFHIFLYKQKSEEKKKEWILEAKTIKEKNEWVTAFSDTIRRRKLYIKQKS